MQAITEEVQYLNELKELGLPVVNNYGTTQVGPRPAIILERIDGISSKSILEDIKKTSENGYKILNKNSIDDLESIRSMMQSKKINVTDLQFMIRRDGRVFINDPMGISYGKGPSEEALEDFETLIDLANRNIGGR